MAPSNCLFMLSDLSPDEPGHYELAIYFPQNDLHLVSELESILDAMFWTFSNIVMITIISLTIERNRLSSWNLEKLFSLSSILFILWTTWLHYVNIYGIEIYSLQLSIIYGLCVIFVSPLHYFPPLLILSGNLSFDSEAWQPGKHCLSFIYSPYPMWLKYLWLLLKLHLGTQC